MWRRRRNNNLVKMRRVTINAVKYIKGWKIQEEQSLVKWWKNYEACDGKSKHVENIRKCPGLKSLIHLNYLHSHAEGSLRIQRGWWSSSCILILIFNAIFIVFIRSIFLSISCILTELLLYLRLLLSHHIRDTHTYSSRHKHNHATTQTHISSAGVMERFPQIDRQQTGHVLHLMLLTSQTCE